MMITDLVNQFNTVPFLFVGSGMSRRYLNLPDWKGLLEHFAQCISDDNCAYNVYENKAKIFECKAGKLAKVAELIQVDFDNKWFEDKNIRTIKDNHIIDQIKNNGLSPFKAEIASYIKNSTIVENTLISEIDKLSLISEKNIAGVITTNYDSFLENTLKGFIKYVGQNQLIFSSIQGIAEIYKIHGSIEEPESIVINETDYVKFNENSAYLAAKLMTTFMEYPIIFMGYSISDSNILNIINSIVNCLDEKQIKTLENRFVFVEYKKGMVGATINPYTLMIGNKPLNMTKITLDDYMILYNALENKKAKLPVKILRRFKQELYNYTITNVPTANLRVASLDDNRVSDEELVLAIGKVSDLGLKGLSGINSNEWYRNIIMNDLEFSADDLLEYAYPNLIKQNSNRLPLNKYLYEATKDFNECKELARKFDFDNIISNTIKKKRKCLSGYTSIKHIWDQENSNLERATRLISHLDESQINIDELEKVLVTLFGKNVDILQTVIPSARTNIRRLIMIYDYLKWGK